MSNKTENKLSRRGGVPLRDTTQGMLSLMEDEKSGILQKINFNKMARYLGWANLGLGLFEVVMPKRVQKLVGVRGKHSGIVRLMGIREIFHALTIFMTSPPQQALWTRVVGDAMDLAFLGAAFAMPKTKKGNAIPVTAAVLGLTALDVLGVAQARLVKKEAKSYSTMTHADLNSSMKGGAFHVTRSITVNRSPEMLYAFWRNFENLPQIMFHVESVRVIDPLRSHWVVKGPAGKDVEWDAEITDDRPNQLIAWHSVPNAEVPNYGFVRFEPSTNGRGTVVHVEIEYRPPAGIIGKTFAKLFGEEPSKQVAGDLHRFKQVMETGEVLRSEGSPEGYGQKLQRPAQPPTGKELEHATQSNPEQQQEKTRMS